jgi:PAS domain S-box-containing protein
MELASIQLAAIVASSEDAIIGKTLDGRIFAWNAAAERLYGYTAAEVQGRHISLLAPPDRPDEISQILARLARGEHISRFETVRVRKDGTRVDISLSISPIKLGDGSISGAATIARDITERKRIEREQGFLAEMSTVLDRTLDYQATLQSIVELLVPTLADYCIIYLVDTDGVYKQVAARHREPDKTQMLMRLNQTYTLDDTSSRSEAVQVLRSRKPILQAAATPPDALLDNPEALAIYRQLAPVTYMLIPLNAYGKVLGTIMLATAGSGRRYDASDLSLAEEAARRCSAALENAHLYQEAQEAIKIRDEFLTIAAHELRTPITGLIGYTQVIQRRMARGQYSDERDQRALQVIIEQSERLKRLVDTLLDVSHIQSGPFSLRSEPIELCALARRIVEQRRVLLNRHRMVL